MRSEPLQERVAKLTALLEVGKAMTAERNLDRLLSLILREVTQVMEADRSSLFLVDKERGELWSKIAQGLEIREIRIKIGEGIAGYVAATGRTVNIREAYEDPRFHKEVDKQTGYRTKTILCVPMINKLGEVIGVIQVLNKLKGTFNEEDEELLLAFAGQAAVAVENATLYEDIERLFEGLIKATMYAIESRDPVTSGHSERVAILTVGLAEKVDRIDVGPYAKIGFSPEEIREIRYAALLHDFGKVGVREPVLVKANKLFEADLELIRSRFKFIKKALEAEYTHMKAASLLTLDREEALGHLYDLDRELKKRWEELDDQLRFIEEVNKPTILPRGGFERILEIATNTYLDLDGQRKPYLTTKEVENLSIGQGSLNTEERLEIESHVVHTFRFLQQIPWTKDLKRVPVIAYAHHEKLNGHGYPNRLAGEAIPIQARIMTIADIYDALTACDRPYKKAIPPEEALKILSLEAEQNSIDQELLQIFIEAKVYELTQRLRRP
ncbi:MAG: HD domain-containing phosphohydrolase, partial [Candidatus Methylomirabilales bacterium]